MGSIPALKKAEYMNSITWPLVSMGEVAEFKNGLNYEGSAVGSGLKMIGVSDFGNNRIISYDKLKQLSGFSDISDEYLLRENDLLFVRSNGNRALVGRAMILKEVYVTYHSFRFHNPSTDCFNSHGTRLCVPFVHVRFH